jgi:integrase
MRNLFKRNGTYYFVKRVDGKQIWKSLKTKDRKEAERRLRKLTATKPDTVADFAKVWLTRFVALNRTAQNQKLAEQRLNDFILPVVGSVSLADIGASHIRGVRLRAEQNGLKPLTVKHILSDFRALLNAAVEEGKLEAVPSFKRILPKIRGKIAKALSDVQIKELLKQASPFQAFVIKLGMYTGLRYGEMRSLRWADVHWTPFPHLVVVGKGGKKRTVPLIPEAQALLTPSANGYVLSRRPLNADSIFRPLNANLTFHFTVHMLRHTFCTRMLSAGYNREALRLWLGHSTIRLIETTYGHCSDDVMVSSLSRLNINPFESANAQELAKGAKR